MLITIVVVLGKTIVLVGRNAEFQLVLYRWIEQVEATGRFTSAPALRLARPINCLVYAGGEIREECALL